MTEIRGSTLDEMARAWQNGQIDPEEYFEWAGTQQHAKSVIEVSERLTTMDAQRTAEAREALKGVVRRVVDLFRKVA